MSDNDKVEILYDFAQRLIENMEDVPLGIMELVNESFWELIND